MLVIEETVTVPESKVVPLGSNQIIQNESAFPDVDIEYVSPVPAPVSSAIPAPSPSDTTTPTTPLDDFITMNVCPFYNPMFNRVTPISIQSQRKELTTAISPYLSNSFDISMLEISAIVPYILSKNSRKEIYRVLKKINNYLDLMPDDTSVLLWASNLYLRLGDFDNAYNSLKKVLETIDSILGLVCAVPNELIFAISTTDPTDIIITNSQSYVSTDSTKFTYTSMARSLNCNPFIVFRTKVATALAEAYFTESRDVLDKDKRRSYELLKKGVSTYDENYKTSTLIDNWGLSQPTTLLDNSNLLVTTRSFIRHNMNQMEYLYNLTIAECNTNLAFTKSIINQHSSCEDALAKFKNGFNSYKEVLEIVHRTNKQHYDFDIGIIGKRSGISRIERDVRDVAILNEDALAKIAPYTFRNIHEESNAELPEGIFRSDTNFWKKYEEIWEKNKTSLMVIDDMFTPEGLTTLRRFVEGTTMWHNPKPSGYICAFLDYGFSSPIVAQAVHELKSNMPKTLCDHRLKTTWGYKYPDGNQADGIDVHSDFAAININCWITPEDTVEEGTGGMIIWPVKPPSNWTNTGHYNVARRIYPMMNKTTGMFEVAFNQTGEQLTTEVYKFTEEAEKITPRVKVPYRSNRCVFFDSSYVHATDLVRFGEGYKSRRINLTFLFGAMGASCSKASAFKQSGVLASELTKKEKLEEEREKARQK